MFVDLSKKAADVVRRNLELTGLSKNASVICGDSLSFLKTHSPEFDIAFLDPPYSTGLLQEALGLVPNVMNKGGCIICEAPQDEKMPESAADFRLVKKYKYGKVSLFLYRIPFEEDDEA